MLHDCAHVGFELSQAINKTHNAVHVELLPYLKHSKFSILKMAYNLSESDCDLVHVHFCRFPAYAAYLSGKPYLIHAHGSDVRKGSGWMQRKAMRKARKILVSTPDLLNTVPDAVWLPTPINPYTFKASRRHEGNQVLYYSKKYEDKSADYKHLCDGLEYELTVIKGLNIPYCEMPKFLNGFDVFIDQTSIPAYSKTALESMACGLAVVGFQDQSVKDALISLKNPSEREARINQTMRYVADTHNCEQVAQQLVHIYQQCLCR